MIQIRELSSAQPGRRWLVWFALVLVLLGLGVTIVGVTSASASDVTGSGNWIDLTTYCSSGVCVPVTVNHRNWVRVNYYRVDSSHRVVYWQDFSGSVYLNSSMCGLHDWSKNGTKYQHAYGTTSITGWYSTGTVCSPGTRCRSFRSDVDYWLTCSSCIGRFRSSTWFTKRCMPNMGPDHGTAVTF